ncbi:hypothetical protein E05_13020 [Plautia stali symbiont]|nr:hypothetical protein E05_13020 [Plautia stali symbiont]
MAGVFTHRRRGVAVQHLGVLDLLSAIAPSATSLHLWLLITVLLALKTFAFTPVADGKAIQTLLLALLSAAVFVPYFKRSQRVKQAFIQP